MIAAPASALAQEAPPPELIEPEVQDIGLLFTQSAASGSLRALKGRSDYVLTLNDVSRQMIWFQDRPGRQSGHMTIRDFAKAWDGYGFADDRPNAALSVLDAADHQDTAILTLGPPRYDAAKRKLRYRVRPESEATGNLAHFEHSHDPGAVERFRHATLFIDDATGTVVNGCLIQVRAQCDGVNLSGYDLSGADFGVASLCCSDFSNSNLTGADFSVADLYVANFRGANLTNANLYGAYAVYAHFNNANFTGANLHDAYFSGADLTGADFTNADLLGTTFSRYPYSNAPAANLTGANFTNADLSVTDFTGANLTGANFTGARFCYTRMPDGSMRNPNCTG